MILAIDAGNTRIKWGVHDGRWLEQGVLAHDRLPDLAEHLQPYATLRRAVVCNVAGASVETAIKTMLEQTGITGLWVTAQAQSNGVSNGYANPTQLGSDRWAALVAAWHFKRSACVVASAGTALTVDALSSRGEFLGGLILPGLDMMRQSLLANTAGVSVVDGSFVDFPATTGDAVHSGALQAMAGAVGRMLDMLEKREQLRPHLLLAGGDASALQAALSGAGEIVDNLVMEGLVLIAGERVK